MATSGPTAIQVRITSDRPASNATTGTSHIHETRRCLLRATSGTSMPSVADDRVGSAISCLFVGLCRIVPARGETALSTLWSGALRRAVPCQAGIEAHGRQHGKNDHQPERAGCRARRYFENAPEMREGGQQYHDEHI